MGVAGGELLIPTIVLLYGTDIKIAGSLSLAVSLPTMLVAFARFSVVPNAVLIPLLVLLLLLSSIKVWKHELLPFASLRTPPEPVYVGPIIPVPPGPKTIDIVRRLTAVEGTPIFRPDPGPVRQRTAPSPWRFRAVRG